MFHFFIVISGEISSTIQGVTSGPGISLMAIAIIILAGLLAGIEPYGIAGAIAVFGKLQPSSDDFDENQGMKVALSFSAGMTVALSALGILSAWGGRILIGYGLLKWIPLLTLVMGLHMMGLIRWKWRGMRTRSNTSGLIDSFWMGIPFGLSTSPCTLPVLITVLTVAAVKGSLVFGLFGLIAFALGRSIPVLLLGAFGGQALSLPMLRKTGPYIHRISGGLIVLISLYFLTIGRNLL